jgi:probable HAF family extracellular repeat protein
MLAFSVLLLGTIRIRKSSVATACGRDTKWTRTEVVGESGTGASGSEVHAFLYSNGTMKDLGTLGGTPSRAFGINARGQVVGSSDLANGGPHAFLFSDGTMTDLGTLVAGSATTVSVAFGINDAGQVVGSSQIAGLSPPNHAVLWQDGNIVDVNPPGWQTIGYAINNRGQIVGSGSNPAGQGHGFLLTPFVDAAY